MYDPPKNRAKGPVLNSGKIRHQIFLANGYFLDMNIIDISIVVHLAFYQQMELSSADLQV